MSAILRLASAALLATALGPPATASTVPSDLVWAGSTTTRQGVSGWYRFTVRAKNRGNQTVTWKMCHDGGFDPGFSPTMGTVSTDFYGWADLSIPFSPPLGACPGDMSSFTIKLCANGVEIARDTGCITIVGNKAGAYYAIVDPQEPQNFVGDKGRPDKISFVVKNEEPDFLPHAYDFLLFNENDLAPGLDLYELTPVSGFDLPTVIGAGTPLMSGKLEEILPFDELLVEVEVTPIPHQIEGAGNLTTLVVKDNDTPAETITSSATVVRCSGSSAEATAHGGRGVNANCFLALDAPVLGREWVAAVDTSRVAAANEVVTTLVFATSASSAETLPFGELLVDVTKPLAFVSAASAAPGSTVALHRNPVPADAKLEGTRLFAQAAIVTPAGVELCNALELTMASERPDFRCVFHEARGRNTF